MKKTNIITKYFCIALVSVLLFVIIFIALKFIKFGSDNNIFTNSTSNSDDVRILVATDLHYKKYPISDNSYVKEVELGTNGRALSYSIDVLTAFRDQIKNEDAEYLILTGDLVQKGDTESLYSFAEILQGIEDDGTQVLLLPGNHDLGKVKKSEVELYRKTLAEFGFSEALSSDEYSLSYVAEIRPDLRILMLDTITYPEGFTKEAAKNMDNTLGWVKAELEKAKNDGVRIITASHENILDHNSFFTEYRFECAEELAKIYEEYDVIVNFCGHIHIQNIREQGHFTDIAQTPLGIYPLSYGIVELTEDKLSYYTKSVDVEKWARSNNLNNEILLNYMEHSKKNFEEATYAMTLYNTEDETLRLYLASINFSFFTGRMDEFSWNEELTNRWKAESYESTGDYLESLRRDIGKNHTVYEKVY